MADLNVSFNKKINFSCQVGDDVFFLKDEKPQFLGSCKSISTDRKSFVIDVTENIRPVIGDYFMFAKNNVINSNGVLGYHGTVTMENTLNEFTELYAVNSEIQISSN